MLSCRKREPGDGWAAEWNDVEKREKREINKRHVDYDELFDDDAWVWG